MPKCPWCSQMKCMHCRCPGYIGCQHNPGEKCPNEKYKRRLKCNPCARRKFEMDQKKGENTTKTFEEEGGDSENETDELPPQPPPELPSLPYSEAVKRPFSELSSNTHYQTFANIDNIANSSTGKRTLEPLEEGMDYGMNDSENDDLSFYKSLAPVSYNRNISEDSLLGVESNSQNTSYSSLLSGGNGGNGDSSQYLLPPPDFYPVPYIVSSTTSYYPNTNNPGSDIDPLSENNSASLQFQQLPPLKDSFFSTSGFPKNVMIFRNKFIHVNVKYNHTPLAIIPIDPARDTLSYVRSYITKRLWQTYPYEFVFLSNTGCEVNQSQESDIFVLSQCTEVEFYEPYNKITILRSHLFISLKDMFSKEDDEFDDYQANLDNNNEDRPIEPTPKRIKRMISNRNNQPELDSQISELTTLFSQAPMEFQELLALKVFSQCHYNLSDDRNDRSLLLTAADNNRISAFLEMLISGADINQRDSHGNTALHICAAKGYTEMLTYIAQIMIDDRAYMCGKPDFLSHNNDGKTPIELVTDDRTKKFLRCCCDRYRRINHNDQNSGTTLKHIKDKIRRDTGDDESIKKLFFIVEGVPILTSQEEDFFAECVYHERGYVVWVPPLSLTLDDIQNESNKHIVATQADTTQQEWGSDSFRNLLNSNVPGSDTLSKRINDNRNAQLDNSADSCIIF